VEGVPVLGFVVFSEHDGHHHYRCHYQYYCFPRKVDKDENVERYVDWVKFLLVLFECDFLQQKTLSYGVVVIPRQE